MRLLRAAAIGCLVFWLSGSTARAEAISRIVVFGDSLSDSGNVYAATKGTIPAPPYFQGRFSNGPVWVERLAAKLGVPAPTPSETGGLDYAYVSAQTGAGLSSQGTPNMLTQAALYSLGHTPAPTDLFVVWGGANDLFVTVGSNPPPNASSWVANLSGLITGLAQKGARQFLVPNLAPLGQIPSLRQTSQQAEADRLSSEFNTALSAELKTLRTGLGVTVYELDAHALFTQAIANPAAYGLTNVTDPAYDVVSGQVVPNPQEYMFWDTVHPTATVHAVLGDAAAAAVPEPSVAVLLTSLAIVFVLAGRPRTPQ